jgi:hypothetical protein
MEANLPSALDRMMSPSMSNPDLLTEKEAQRAREKEEMRRELASRSNKCGCGCGYVKPNSTGPRIVQGGKLWVPVLDNLCACCRVKFNQVMVCSRCKTARYCSQACQRAHWPEHKKHCHKPGATPSAPSEH